LSEKLIVSQHCMGEFYKLAQVYDTGVTLMGKTFLHSKPWKSSRILAVTCMYTEAHVALSSSNGFFSISW